MALGRVLTLRRRRRRAPTPTTRSRPPTTASRAAPVPDHRRRRGQQARRRPGSTPRSGSAATPVRREVVVLRLYGQLAEPRPSRRDPAAARRLPHRRVVAHATAPAKPSADPIGAMAQRRITDAAESSQAPRAALRRLAEGYVDGDTDLAWTRITLWRGLLAAALDQPPYEPVTSATVVAAPDSPSGRPAGRLAGRAAALPGLDRPRPQPQRHHLGAARAHQRHGRPGAPARRQHGHAVPARPAGTHRWHSRTGAMPSASPTSCGASTPTRSTRTPW